MGELKLEKIKIGQYANDYKTYTPSKKNSDFENQVMIFQHVNNDTLKTDYVEDVKLYLTAKDTKANATDIIRKTLRLKNADFLKNSDMFDFFKTINIFEFDMDGFLYSGNNIKIKNFSIEKDGYGIVDKSGNIYKFDKNGKYMLGNGNKFASIGAAHSAVTISSIQHIGVIEE